MLPIITVLDHTSLSVNITMIFFSKKFVAFGLGAYKFTIVISSFLVNHFIFIQ
jgi:hypothetical protein